MARFRLLVAYDGTRYCGWQRQPSARTVQGSLEDALRRMNRGEPIELSGASRTDAGVHAEGQVAAFDYEGPIDARIWQRGLNGLTPDDIVVRQVVEVPAAFHPRFDARGKWYRYLLWVGRHVPPMLRRRVWGTGPRVDLGAMRDAATHLLGEHDFAAFRAANCNARTSTRRLDSVDIAPVGSHYHWALDGEDGALVAIDVRGNAFLKYMVRIIVGTLVDVGRGGRSPDDVADVLSSCDRSRAGKTAPAQGLTLVKVFYDAPKEP